jgi:hypothetical protein
MPEISYPAVYVAEVAFHAQAIDGVQTSTAGFVAGGFAGERGAPQLATPSPDWSDANSHDPGLTTLELFDWPLLSLRMHPALTGIASGLAVDASGDGSASVTVSPGTAVGADGADIAPDERVATIRTLCGWPWP